MITKKAENLNSYKRGWVYTNSAREAWSNIIERYKAENSTGVILLPSYIGWSANEGSGIFDSVLNSGMKYDFYELGVHLEINFDDLKEKTAQYPKQLVLLVHYFGFMDTNYTAITNWLLQNNIFFVEDCAHAWFSDIVGGVCGRKGNFAFYSLHKLLPLSGGGMEVINKNEDSREKTNPFFDLGYDIYQIYKTRRDNYNYLFKLLGGIKEIDVIYKTLEDGICPQTLPVILENFDRNELYHKMNEAGFGMVSLYHTMIDQLKNSPSGAASILSKKIINFPVHQDVNKEQMDAMVLKLKEILYA